MHQIMHIYFVSDFVGVLVPVVWLKLLILKDWSQIKCSTDSKVAIRNMIFQNPNTCKCPQQVQLQFSTS